MSNDLALEAPDDPAYAIDQGVLVMAPDGRRPGAIFMGIVRTLEDRTREQDFESPMQAVVDLRRSAFSPSSAEIRTGASRLGALNDRGRIALLVANDFQFGLGRMLGMLSEGTGFDVRPFRDANEAAEWAREG